MPARLARSSRSWPKYITKALARCYSLIRDALWNVRLNAKYRVGATYEVYRPIAYIIKDTYNATFTDDYNCTLTITYIGFGMLWTKDLAYGRLAEGTRPPTPHEQWGVPLPTSLYQYIRPVTDE